ncbi:MAG: TrbI/VirB10 family protein [Caulobacter sp.]|nr:TrbI/VirB10 family protein [Caulobacter sp.]
MSALEPDPRDGEADEAFRLRGAPPRVVRLSRKGLAVAGGLGAAALGAALTFALSPRSHAPPPTPATPPNDARQTAEAVTAAPKDYGQTPRLGPPLPGDLGRPILAAQGREPVTAPSAGGASAEPPSASPPSSRPSPAAQARQAALSSSLLVDVGKRRSSSPAADSAGATAALVAAASAAPGGALGGGKATPATLTPLASPYTLLAGSVIPAALVTGLNSELPGQAIAQVTADVYDTVTGQIRLIPAGARLIGAYDAQVAFGQSRIQVVWTRLVFPDGAAIDLAKQSAADLQGFAGLTDRVDNHWGAIAKAAVLSSVLGVSAELASDDDGDVVRALRRGAQDTVNQAGQQIVRRQLDIRPTLKVRPGHPVRLILTEDLVLDPQRSGAMR